MIKTSERGEAMLAGEGLGKRIKQLRRERHITAEAFAESVNISISFLREIERGNKKPALDNFIKIANELGAELRVREWIQNGY